MKISSKFMNIPLVVGRQMRRFANLPGNRKYVNKYQCEYLVHIIIKLSTEDRNMIMSSYLAVCVDARNDEKYSRTPRSSFDQPTESKDDNTLIFLHNFDTEKHGQWKGADHQNKRDSCEKNPANICWIPRSGCRIREAKSSSQISLCRSRRW